MKNLRASKNAISDIQRIAYPGQEPKMRQYKAGYEDMFNKMPVITGSENILLLASKVEKSSMLMRQLGDKIKAEVWPKLNTPSVNDFDRTILALETPVPTIGYTNIAYKEGAEFIIARWGAGFKSPVHGHTPGFLHEELIHGKMRVNTYRITGPNSNKVRPVETVIAKPGTIVSTYKKPDPTSPFKRHALVHNFVAVEPSVSLHYVPEHTRDGRDNGFEVEYFEDVINLQGKVTRVTAQQALHTQIGDVILVRSSNVPEYGDHFIIITGHPVIKEHGLRPQEKVIPTGSNTLLNNYKMEQGLILLKLNAEAREQFLKFHKIKVECSKVILPEA